MSALLKITASIVQCNGLLSALFHMQSHCATMYIVTPANNVDTGPVNWITLKQKLTLDIKTQYVSGYRFYQQEKATVHSFTAASRYSFIHLPRVYKSTTLKILGVIISDKLSVSDHLLLTEHHQLV